MVDYKNDQLDLGEYKGYGKVFLKFIIRQNSNANNNKSFKQLITELPHVIVPIVLCLEYQYGLVIVIGVVIAEERDSGEVRRKGFSA